MAQMPSKIPTTGGADSDYLGTGHNQATQEAWNTTGNYKTHPKMLLFRRNSLFRSDPHQIIPEVWWLDSNHGPAALATQAGHFSKDLPCPVWQFVLWLESGSQGCPGPGCPRSWVTVTMPSWGSVYLRLWLDLSWILTSIILSGFSFYDNNHT